MPNPFDLNYVGRSAAVDPFDFDEYMASNMFEDEPVPLPSFHSEDVNVDPASQVDSLQSVNSSQSVDSSVLNVVECWDILLRYYNGDGGLDRGGAEEALVSLCSPRDIAPWTPFLNSITEIEDMESPEALRVHESLTKGLETAKAGVPPTSVEPPTTHSSLKGKGKEVEGNWTKVEGGWVKEIWSKSVGQFNAPPSQGAQSTTIEAVTIPSSEELADHELFGDFLKEYQSSNLSLGASIPHSQIFRFHCLVGCSASLLH